MFLNSRVPKLRLYFYVTCCLTKIDFFRYRNNIKKMSTLSKDEPERSLNRAVWWAEYVLRHNGAKHLRSAALDLTWYQYFLLDIVVILFLLLTITILILYLFLKNVYKYLIAKDYKVKCKHD
jgi:glucuronosyltransferase